MGKAHSQAYRNVNMFFPDAPKVEMKVMVGRNAQETEQAAKRYGWQEASTDWKAVMRRPDIDLVDISTPGNVHYEMVMAAAKAKKHIVCEKPLGNNLKETKAMAAAAKKAGIRHFLMHNYRRAPAVALAKRMVNDGRLGQLYHFRARYLQDWAMSPELPLLWRFDKTQAGTGALGDLGSHIIDLAQYLCGSITHIAAASQTFIGERPVSWGSKSRKKVTVDDAIVMCTRFANGAIGTLEATRFALGRKNHNTFEINGSKGSAVFDLENLNNLHYCSAGDAGDAQGFREIIVCGNEHPYGGHWWPEGHILGYEHTFTHSVNDFLAAIQSGEEIHPDFNDGLRNAQVLDAVEKAARTGRWEKAG